MQRNAFVDEFCLHNCFAVVSFIHFIRLNYNSLANFFIKSFILAAQESASLLHKRIEVHLEKDGHTFGFTLRGGLNTDRKKSRPLTITQIRPGSTADRYVQGLIQTPENVLELLA